MDKELIERLKREAGVYEAEDAQALIACCEALVRLTAEECAKLADEAEEWPSAGPAIRAKFAP